MRRLPVRLPEDAGGCRYIIRGAKKIESYYYLKWAISRRNKLGYHSSLWEPTYLPGLLYGPWRVYPSHFWPITTNEPEERRPRRSKIGCLDPTAGDGRGFDPKTPIAVV